VLYSAKIPRENAAEVVANFDLRRSGADCPRQSTHGKAGTPMEEMKHKRAETKAAKQQRSDRYMKNPSTPQLYHGWLVFSAEV